MQDSLVRFLLSKHRSPVAWCQCLSRLYRSWWLLQYKPFKRVDTPGDTAEQLGKARSSECLRQGRSAFGHWPGLAVFGEVREEWLRRHTSFHWKGILSGGNMSLTIAYFLSIWWRFHRLQKNDKMDDRNNPSRWCSF